MASDDRFYMMEMRNRPVMFGDVGSLVKIEGLIVGGGGSRAALLLPDYFVPQYGDRWLDNVARLSVEEWSDWLQRSDNPEILIGPSPIGMDATLAKIWHRKLRYEISGAVQQKIWAADHFECVYCHAPMGRALLTIDHWVPLELGGKNNVTNYLTACKSCNKDKGSEDPVVWCGRRGYRHQHFVDYLGSRVVK